MHGSLCANSSALAPTADQRAGGILVGPYLASLRALNIGSLLLAASAARGDWGWLSAAGQLRGLALTIPASTRQLRELWPGLEVRCLAV